MEQRNTWPGMSLLARPLIVLAWTASAPALAGSLTADPNVLNFGQVSVSGNPVSLALTLTNVGSNTEISGFSVGSGCAEFSVLPDSLPLVLGNEDTALIHVNYDPIDRNADSCSVMPLSTGTGGEFTLQGDGVAAVVTTLTTSLNFASQRWNGGTPEILNITIENSGEESIDLSNLSAEAATGTNFFIGTPVGLPISNGETATLPITFNPVSAGLKSDTVTISINNDSPLEPNDQVLLSGTGTQSLQTFSVATLDIGSFIAGSGSGIAVMDVGNAGTASLNLSSVSITGEHATDFSFEDHGCSAQGPCTPSPAQIPVSGNAEPFSIRCAPSGNGLRSAILSVFSDDPASPRSADLTCNGTVPVNLIFENGFESDGWSFERVTNTVSF